MDWLEPKKRSILVFVLCVIGAIICYFFTTFGIIIAIDLLILAFLSLLMYFISKNIDIRMSHGLFYIFILIGCFIAGKFNESSFAFNLGIKDWEKHIKPVIIEHCTTQCSIKGRKLYNSKNNKIYSWYDLNYIYEGVASASDRDISYQISFDDKCVTKEIKKDFVISKGRCTKNE